MPQAVQVGEHKSNNYGFSMVLYLEVFFGMISHKLGQQLVGWGWNDGFSSRLMRISEPQAGTHTNIFIFFSKNHQILVKSSLNLSDRDFSILSDWDSVDCGLDWENTFSAFPFTHQR